MSGSDIALTFIIAPVQIVIAYFVILALLRGYKSENRIRDLTKQVHLLQTEIDALERKSSKHKEK